MVVVAAAAADGKRAALKALRCRRWPTQTSASRHPLSYSCNPRVANRPAPSAVPGGIPPTGSAEALAAPCSPLSRRL